MKNDKTKSEQPNIEEKAAGNSYAESSGSNRYSSVEELAKDLVGTLCDKRCPRCGSQLLTNSRPEFWCSHVDCDYGLED